MIIGSINMRVILNINKKGYIHGLTQVCETPEGFQAIKEMHPEDTFIIEGMFSQMLYDELIEFLAFMGWDTTALAIAIKYQEANYMPAPDEQDEIFDEMVEQYLEKMADEWELRHCH